MVGILLVDLRCSLKYYNPARNSSNKKIKTGADWF